VIWIFGLAEFQSVTIFLTAATVGGWKARLSNVNFTTGAFGSTLLPGAELPVGLEGEPVAAAALDGVAAVEDAVPAELDEPAEVEPAEPLPELQALTTSASPQSAARAAAEDRMLMLSPSVRLRGRVCGTVGRSIRLLWKPG